MLYAQLFMRYACIRTHAYTHTAHPEDMSILYEIRRMLKENITSEKDNQMKASCILIAKNHSSVTHPLRYTVAICNDRPLHRPSLITLL